MKPGDEVKSKNARRLPPHIRSDNRPIDICAGRRSFPRARTSPDGGNLRNTLMTFPRNRNLLSKAFAGVPILAACCLAAFGLAGCGPKDDPHTLRAGFFPNVTHAQAVIAREMAREGKPWFEPRLPAGWKLEWMGFNAGPSAMEALIAESVDVTYVGPGPVINAHIRTKGSFVRVLSGAALGGSALLVPKDSTLRTPADFRGKRLATPQLGNTQDIACRSWLAEGGLKFTLTGGEVSVVPTQNADLADMLATGRTDGVWTVEPWSPLASKDRPAPRSFSNKAVRSDDPADRRQEARPHPDPKRPAIDAFLAAHRALTAWIKANPDEAVTLLHKGLSFEQHTKDIPKDRRRKRAPSPEVTFTDKGGFQRALGQGHEGRPYRRTSSRNRRPFPRCVNTTA